jgi:DNA-directed RNA polymerase specialized sigma subunit
MDGPVTTYRVTISREDPWWTAVAHGPGLPTHGAATETRTIADLEEKIRDLIVLRTDADMNIPYDKAVHSFDLEWSYDLLAEAADALRDYQQSKRELAEAQNRYADRAEQAAAVLTTTVHASLRDTATLMGISYQRVSQLLAAMRGRLAAKNSRKGGVCR